MREGAGGFGVSSGLGFRKDWVSPPRVAAANSDPSADHDTCTTHRSGSSESLARELRAFTAVSDWMDDASSAPPSESAPAAAVEEEEVEEGLAFASLAAV